MALINCPQCGKTMSDQAEKCPHCGATVAPSSSFGDAEMTIKWDGFGGTRSFDVNLTINKIISKTFSFKNRYEDSVAVNEGQVKVNLKFRRFIDDQFTFSAEKGKKYNMHINYNRWFGGFKYIVTDESGNLVHEQDYATWRKVWGYVSIPLYILLLIYVLYTKFLS